MNLIIKFCVVYFFKSIALYILHKNAQFLIHKISLKVFFYSRFDKIKWKKKRNSSCVFYKRETWISVMKNPHHKTCVQIQTKPQWICSLLMFLFMAAIFVYVLNSIVFKLEPRLLFIAADHYVIFRNIIKRKSKEYYNFIPKNSKREKIYRNIFHYS